MPSTWLPVQVSSFLDSRSISYAYLWALLGSSLMIGCIAVMGESLIEDGIKVVIVVLSCLLVLASWGLWLPVCVALVASPIAVFSNQQRKRK